MTTDGHDIALASRSPRRLRLLREHAFRVRTVESGVDDAVLLPGRASPPQWVASLAYLKARAALDRLDPSLPPPRVILGADTLCVADGRLVGQALDESHALDILRSFVDRAHEVLTGVAILDPRSRRRELFADRAIVRVGPIPEPDLRAYVATGAWRGKAGAYNLSERLDAGWPITFEGDPTTIVGLPMRALERRLAGRWSVHPSVASAAVEARP